MGMYHLQVWFAYVPWGLFVVVLDSFLLVYYY